MAERITIADLNALDRDQFVALLGAVFEESPWVAAHAWERRPFADVAELHRAMRREVERAPRAERLRLLRAHPDLGARARMSAASAGEQAGAGLDRLTAEEFRRLQDLNTAYREKFGFPFLFAVRGSTKAEVIDALERRLGRAPDEEMEEALRQVSRIARFRLEQLLVEGSRT